MNRRNVLTGLGGLAISGGALFGSGAFTSVSAEREVEVNLLGGANGVVGGGASDDRQEDIAESITKGAVDVLVDLSLDTIAVEDSGGTTYTNGSDLYPSPDRGSVYSSDPGFSEPEEQYVSLVANDVSIVFGSKTGLPQNSNITYSDLFAFADPNSTTVDVNFATSNESDRHLLTGIGSDGTDLSDADVRVASVTGISNGDTADATVATGETDEATETLKIGIGEDPTT